MDKERVEYIDVAKGLGIILVIFGHIKYEMPGDETICNFIYSFHMPLFFVISGLCIKESKKLNIAQLKKMSKSYLIPYAVWTIFYIFATQLIAIIRGNESIISASHYMFAHAISLCGVAPLWFLLALFIAEVLVLWMKPSLKMVKNGDGGGTLF